MSYENHKNFTAFKVYVSIYRSITEDIEDRFMNDRQKLRSQKATMKQKVIDWCETNPALYETGYKIRFDQYCGCSCPCSPGFRISVHESDVHNSGYTQLLRLRRGSNGPKTVYIDNNNNVNIQEH